MYRLFSSLKTDELGAWDWPAEQREQLIRMQYQAHQQHHQPGTILCDDYIVCLFEQSIGRLILQRTDTRIQLADIVLLPEFRNLGIGTQLIRQLQHEAQQTQRSLRLSVYKTNAVVALYRRLGFELIEENDAQYQMQWQAPMLSDVE